MKKKHEWEEIIKRLFVSRHFLVFIASVFLIFFGKVNGQEFCWLMLIVMGTNTAEKLKDSIKIGK